MTDDKGVFQQYKEESRSHTAFMCKSITEGRSYQELYSISKGVKRCDGDNLIVGVLGLFLGFILWLFSILWPLLTKGVFHMGVMSAIGLCILIASITYYIGAYRILHPIARYTAEKKDDRIYDILKTRHEDVSLIEEADNPNPTERTETAE